MFLVLYSFIGNCSSNIRHVIHIVVDGLSGIYLRQAVEEAPDLYPNFVRLVRGGAVTFNARTDYYHSETLPNMVSIVTARPVDRKPGMPASAAHNINFNTWIPDVTIHSYGDPEKGYISSVFDVAHDNGMITGFFATKQKLSLIVDSYNEINGAQDLIGEDNGSNKIDFVDVRDAYTTGWVVVGSFLDKMREYYFNYVFLHISELDYFGHQYGWGSEMWYYYLTIVDQYLGWIFDLVETDSELSGKTAIVLTADHGGGVPYNTHVYPEYLLNTTVPIIVWGPGFSGGSDLYDYFSNRYNPGLSRPNTTALNQPLRNADTANIALTLLGLSFINGSWWTPIFGEKPVALSYVKTGRTLVLRWRASATNYILEFTDSLPPFTNWTPVRENILNDGSSNYYYFSLDEQPYRFFRLRQLP